MFPVNPGIRAKANEKGPTSPRMIRNTLLTASSIYCTIFASSVITQDNMLVLLLIGTLKIIVAPIFMLSQSFSQNPISSPLETVSSAIDSI